MKTHRQFPSLKTRKGFVLLAVLVFILLLSMITLSLLFRSQGDELAGNATAGSEQAWAAAMSGIEEAMRVAAAAPPGATDWQDDPSLFRARAVYNDGADQWSFTVFSPADADALVETRYGLTDEAARINLNYPGSADLTKLPHVTPALATALRQFIGLDPAAASTPDLTALVDVATPADATSPDATQVATLGTVIPYHGPLATLDELFLLPGLNRALLHGALPAPADPSAPQVNGDGPQLPQENPKSKRTPGLDQYFTVFSTDPNRSTTNSPRCNLNDPDSPLPAAELPAGFSNYVATLRSAKIQLSQASQALEATVKAPNEKGVEVEVASEITKENLPLLLDLFTTEKDDSHPGLINVNTASAQVLATLPGIDLPLAESIVSTRSSLSPEHRATIAWLYQENLLDADKFKAIAPSLTARSSQFHLTVIGYGLPSGRFRVLEAVIDLAGADPRIIYLRDITRLGLPIRLKEENIAKPDANVAFHPANGRLNYPHG